MSGSNALAAAKRRRGGSQELNKGPPPPGSRGLQRGAQPPNQGVPPQVNPLQLVMINHHRLNSLQNELPKAIDSLGESLNSLSSNCDYLHENLKTIQEEMNGLKSSKGVSSDVETKLNKIELDLSESHKVVLKTQSFSMDLSTQVLKLKEDYNNLLLSVNKRMDDLESNSLSSQNLFNEHLIQFKNEKQLLVDELTNKLREVSELLMNKENNVVNDVKSDVSVVVESETVDSLQSSDEVLDTA